MKFIELIAFFSLGGLYFLNGLAAPSTVPEHERPPVSVRSKLKIPEYDVWLEREDGEPPAVTNPRGPKKRFTKFKFKITTLDTDDRGDLLEYGDKVGYLTTQWMPNEPIGTKTYSVFHIEFVGVGPGLIRPGLKVSMVKPNALQKRGYGSMAMETLLVAVKKCFPGNTFVLLQCPADDHLSPWYEKFGSKTYQKISTSLPFVFKSLRIKQARFPYYQALKGKSKDSL